LVRKEISLQIENKPLVQVLEEISHLTNLEFIFGDRLIDGIMVTCDVQNKTAEETLKLILSPWDIDFKEVQNGRIVLYKPSLPDSRFKISGRVTDVSTNMPLYFANVFLSNTALGSATDTEGYYIIYNVPLGQFEIVASMMGYEFDKKKVQLIDSTEVVVHFQLRPKILEGKLIEVTAKQPKVWKKELKLFNKLFFSVNKFTKNCKIENPQVLSFDYDDDNLHFAASAKSSIIIINEALGYEVTFILERFDTVLNEDINETLRSEFNRGRMIDYKGLTKFKELTPKNKKQKKEWDENRAKAYYGSKRHFFKSLFENRLEEEGFEIYRSNYPIFKAGLKIEADRILIPGPHPFQRILLFENLLSVAYRHEPDDIKYQIELMKRMGNSRGLVYSARNPSRTAVNPYRNLGLDRISANSSQQVSWLRLTQTKSVLIDARGIISEGHRSIRFSGFWYWDSPAEWLPVEYEPSKNNQ